MKKNEPVLLSDLMANLASDAVAVQKVLDAQHSEDLRAFRQMLMEAPEAYKELLSPLAPKRQRLNSYEVKARIGFGQEKSVSVGVGIGVHLFHFSADLRFQRDISNDSQVHFCIEQVPCEIKDFSRSNC